MTKDQLEAARKIEIFADASRQLSQSFKKEGGDSPVFTKSSRGENALRISGYGGHYLPLTNEARPEVFMAWQACQALMQQALDAEARRWAKEFDEFTITA